MQVLKENVGFNCESGQFAFVSVAMKVLGQTHI